MKNLNTYITERQWLDAEVKNAKLRKLLDKAGLQNVHLFNIRRDGYFFVGADEDTPEEEWLNTLESTAIYMNSFNQQSPEEWFNDIKSMLDQGKENCQ